MKDVGLIKVRRLKRLLNATEMMLQNNHFAATFVDCCFLSVFSQQLFKRFLTENRFFVDVLLVAVLFFWLLQERCAKGCRSVRILVQAFVVCFDSALCKNLPSVCKIPTTCQANLQHFVQQACNPRP